MRTVLNPKGNLQLDTTAIEVLPMVLRQLLSKLVCLLFLLTLSNTSSASETLSFNVTPKSYPPFFVRDENGDSGIFLDIVTQVTKQNGDRLNMVRIPRKRGNQWVKNGQLNAVIRAIEWVPRAAQFSFSEPIIQFKSVLVSRADRALEFSQVNDLRGKKLLTHLGFKYPKLQPFFEMKSIQRVDVDSQLKMLQMLQKGRADGAVINEKVALWLIKKHHLQGQFHLSANNFGTFNIRVMFDKSNQAYVERFNQSLSIIKGRGVIDQVLNKYR